jgi:TonB family protein
MFSTIGKFARATLALIILNSCSSPASQLPQQGSTQEDKPQIVAPALGNKAPKVYSVGGNVSAPRVISSAQPSLDQEQSKQLGPNKNVAETGTATLRIVVGEDGSVRSAKVLRSFNRDMDLKAIDAVKQWKFNPAKRKGVPVAVELEVQVDFRLY